MSGPLQGAADTPDPSGKGRSREVKLGEMLESLIERGGYNRNRKKILSALDISAAALSQYVREQTRPSFGKLLAIADFFDVVVAEELRRMQERGRTEEQGGE